MASGSRQALHVHALAEGESRTLFAARSVESAQWDATLTVALEYRCEQVLPSSGWCNSSSSCRYAGIRISGRP